MGPTAVSKPIHTVQTKNGSIYAFCSDYCFEKYMGKIQPDCHYVEIKAPTYECIACYWCGNVMGKAKDCFRHETGCPNIDWKLTYQASVVLYALAQLVSDDIPEELIDDCEHFAKEMSPDTDGRIIAQACWNGWKFFE
jgi:hypothetical protein